MKKRFNLATVIALMLLVSVTTYYLTEKSAQLRLDNELRITDEITQSTKKFVDARKTILERFIGEITEEELNEGAVLGMIQTLNDQWSAYLTAEQYAEQTNPDKSFVGIGVTVQHNAETGEIIVTEVFKDSPAEDAGMLTGDIIYSVEGTLVSKLGYTETVARIRGQEDTSVTLEVLRGGVRKSITMPRRSVTRQMILSEWAGDVGYIRIVGFETRVDTDFNEAVRRLQEAGVKGLILDVRDNPGGSVDVMCGMLDLLLPKGRLITLRSKDGVEEHKESNASSIDLPMVVLINENSYSAAEFFAACIKEYDRGVTVGVQTTGKGYAQQDIPQSDGSAIHLSVLRYFTPNGVSLAGVGLTPDFPVALTAAERLVPLSDHENDRQYQKAAEILTGLIAAQDGAEDADEEG